MRASPPLALILRNPSQILTAALRNAQQAGALELSKPQRKQLSSLGHLLERFAAACDQLLKRPDKFPDFAPWLRDFTNAEPCAPSGEGWSVNIVSLNPLMPLRLQTLVSDRELLAVIADSWNLFHPDKKITTGESLTSSPAFRASLWPALLRLRPLREFWERALRRDAVETLLQILPDAWLLDPGPLPPGAVIPRLELASWDKWEVPSDTAAVYSISPAVSEAQTRVQHRDDIAAALKKFPHDPQILTAHDASRDAPLLLSLSVRKAGRTDWLGALALTSPDSQPQIARAA